MPYSVCKGDTGGVLETAHGRRAKDRKEILSRMKFSIGAKACGGMDFPGGPVAKTPCSQ